MFVRLLLSTKLFAAFSPLFWLHDLCVPDVLVVIKADKDKPVNDNAKNNNKVEAT